MERRVPTKEEVLGYLKEDRNWAVGVPMTK